MEFKIGAEKKKLKALKALVGAVVSGTKAGTQTATAMKKKGEATPELTVVAAATVAAATAAATVAAATALTTVAEEVAKGSAFTKAIVASAAAAVTTKKIVGEEEDTKAVKAAVKAAATVIAVATSSTSSNESLLSKPSYIEALASMAAIQAIEDVPATETTTDTKAALIAISAVLTTMEKVSELMVTALPAGILHAIEDWYATTNDTIQNKVKITDYPIEEKMDILQKNIANIRILAGLSPTKFADELKITKQALHNWETKKNKINFIQYEALINLFQKFIFHKNKYGKKRCSEDIFLKIILIIIYPEFYSKEDFTKGQEKITTLAALVARPKDISENSTLINNLEKEIPSMPEKTLNEITENFTMELKPIEI